MSYAVLVLEQPWWDLNEDPEQTSVRHFLEGLSRLEGLPLFYATFYDTNSLGLALKYLMDAEKLDEVKRLIIYIAAHGEGGRLGNGQAPSTNLGTLFERIKEHGRDKVAGLILDSCELGAQVEKIEQGMSKAGIKWVLGYRVSVDWLTTVLINLRVLSTMSALEPRQLNTLKHLRGAMQEAVSAFCPFLAIGEDKQEENDDEDATMKQWLSNALTVVVAPARQPIRPLSPKELWPELPEMEEDEPAAAAEV